MDTGCSIISFYDYLAKPLCPSVLVFDHLKYVQITLQPIKMREI